MLVLGQVAEPDYFRWQPHPEVWVLLLGLIGLYVYALKTLGPRLVPEGTPVVTPAQKRWFVFGITLLWIAADWPMHDISEEYLYSVHMVQHMLLTFIIPPVMLLATPEWLARIVIGDGKLGRAFLKLARPIPAAVVFNAVQLGTHWSGIVNTSVENGLLHYGLHTVVVVTALAVWMPVVSPLRELRIEPPAQCIHLFLTSIVPTIPAAWLALADGVLYDAYDKPARLWGIGVTSDQQAAGLIMKLGGGVFLWIVIVFIFFRWSAKQDHGTTARRAIVDDDGNVVGVEDRVGSGVN
ncbi:cytochrome c oxidase assembly protein [Actinospongicola halichondriae]|uniref:cytochrome c oxidase assembly protein n=1 Tax=Actinospongicola halichondriae TaxID=3236844 RepID=UPI003D44AADC